MTEATALSPVSDEELALMQGAAERLGVLAPEEISALFSELGTAPAPQLPDGAGRASWKAESSGTGGRWHSCSEAGTAVPGASDAEILLMCQAAARLGFPVPSAAAAFSALAASFPAHSEGRADYHKSGGHHWCVQS